MHRLFVLLCLMPLPVFAGEKCNLAVYTDHWSAAPGIVAGPWPGEKRIGIAPHTADNADFLLFGANVTITEMQNGMAYATNIVSADGKITAPDGWIDGNDILFTTDTPMMYALPNTTSAVVATDKFGFYIDALLDCDGAWAKVTLHDDNEIYLTGWVPRICGVQRGVCADD